MCVYIYKFDIYNTTIYIELLQEHKEPFCLFYLQMKGTFHNH